MFDTLPGVLQMMLSQNSSRLCWGGLVDGLSSGGGEPGRLPGGMDIMSSMMGLRRAVFANGRRKADDKLKDVLRM